MDYEETSRCPYVLVLVGTKVVQFAINSQDHCNNQNPYLQMPETTLPETNKKCIVQS
jgi:hypothetical protein